MLQRGADDGEEIQEASEKTFSGPVPGILLNEPQITGTLQP